MSPLCVSVALDSSDTHRQAVEDVEGLPNQFNGLVESLQYLTSLQCSFVSLEPACALRLDLSHPRLKRLGVLAPMISYTPPPVVARLACPQLRRLELCNVQRAQSFTVAGLASVAPDLRSVIIRHADRDQSQLLADDASAALRGAHRLSELLLQMREGGVSFSAYASSLQTLSLCGTAFGAESEFVELTEGCPRLVSLVLDDVGGLTSVNAIRHSCLSRLQLANVSLADGPLDLSGTHDTHAYAQTRA
jgi:hypothetical protein